MRQRTRVLQALHDRDDLYVGKRHAFGAGERDHGIGSAEHAHLLKRGLDPDGQSPGFAFIYLRRGIEHHEKRKHEGDAISVGNQPALVADVVVLATPFFFRRVIWLTCAGAPLGAR